mmetsp:Transcript_75883/g.139734  ORF Transcript_75883/g.139734 Transcript_75883/m.139734 type:complete len:208 (+) Transcript_75883:224-847(+)
MRGKSASTSSLSDRRARAMPFSTSAASCSAKPGASSFALAVMASHHEGSSMPSRAAVVAALPNPSPSSSAGLCNKAKAPSSLGDAGEEPLANAAEEEAAGSDNGVRSSPAAQPRLKFGSGRASSTSFCSALPPKSLPRRGCHCSSRWLTPPELSRPGTAGAARNVGVAGDLLPALVLWPPPRNRNGFGGIARFGREAANIAGGCNGL